MSAELLSALQRAHAFDPFPVREDLGVYHVPFSRLVDSAHVEATLLDSCRRFERVAVVGDSGTGKSSLTARVLGPLAEGVAPILVPVAVEPSETVNEPRAMRVFNDDRIVSGAEWPMHPTPRHRVADLRGGGELPPRRLTGQQRAPRARSGANHVVLGQR